MSSSNLVELFLAYQKLTQLPDLSPYHSLKILSCFHNQLTSLPSLPETLISLDCSQNQLKELPILPPHLERLYCINNQLTFLPDLPSTLIHICCLGNPLIYKENTVSCINETNQKIKKFKKFYYCLKYKKPFRKWLWERVREKEIRKKYHPDRIKELLNQDMDWEDLDY
jgi:Leucine-rich repeat (LRR) protein